MKANAMAQHLLRIYNIRYADKIRSTEFYNKWPTTGWTGLHCVAYAGAERYLDLLRRGASLDSEDQIIGGTPLAWATAQGHSSIVKTLFAHGANPERGINEGGTALYWAAREGRTDLVELLLGSGVDSNAVNWKGASPLAVASKRGHEDAVALLIAHGTDPSLRDKDGRTPLSRAAERGAVGIVRLLLAMDPIDVDAMDDHNGTPLSYALMGRHTSVAEVLLAEGGADPC